MSHALFDLGMAVAQTAVTVVILVFAYAWIRYRK